MHISRLVYSHSSSPTLLLPNPTHFSSVLPPSRPAPPTLLALFPSPNRQTLNRLSLSVSKATSDSDPDLHNNENDDLGKLEGEEDGDVDVEILKLGKNSRRISCGIGVDADLKTVWDILTDYENLADFIPGLAVCQLLEKVDNRARLFQIGQQNLAFGLKFNAKGVVDCYEKDLEKTPLGQKRDIDFEMIEGDFQVFKGKWSIKEVNESTSVEQGFQTTLSYVVDVKPKLWLPVRLVEGRLCREIKLNLLCIREQAQKTVHSKLHTS